MLKKGTAFVLVFAVLLIPSTAYADWPWGAEITTETRLIPPYTPCVHAGERQACYTFEQQQWLNQLEIEARGWYMQWNYYVQLAFEQEEILALKDAEIIEWQAANDLMGLRVNELLFQLNTAIEEKNEYRRQAESRPTWPLFLGGALTLIGVGLITAAAVTLR